MKRNNKGFTLIELIVATAIGTLVLAAATTVILLGIRVNNQANETAKNQFTTRTLMTLLEDLSSEGKITKVTTNTAGWVIMVRGKDNTERVALSYAAEELTIYTGDKDNGGTPVMTGVYASYVTMADKLLTFSMETEQGTFASTLNCRTANEWLKGNVTDATVPGDLPADDERKAFLSALGTQYTTAAVNKGQIVGGTDAGQYYAQWYIENTKPEGQPSPWNVVGSGWNPKTPWCVCFISWGLAQSGLSDPPCYANVDEFMATFTGSNWLAAGGTPTPGDLVFFDWNVNGVSDAEHIGAVLKVEDGKIYTIEGNSAGVVAIRQYALDSEYILGYGILNW